MHLPFHRRFCRVTFECTFTYLIRMTRSLSLSINLFVFDCLGLLHEITLFRLILLQLLSSARQCLDKRCADPDVRLLAPHLGLQPLSPWIILNNEYLEMRPSALGRIFHHLHWYSSHFSTAWLKIDGRSAEVREDESPFERWSILFRSLVCVG